MRRAYIAITAVLVIFVMFATFVPLFPEGFPFIVCTIPGQGCRSDRIDYLVSMTYRLFNVGAVLYGPSYQFFTTPPNLHPS